MGPIGMIWWGIAKMRRASEHRDHQHEETMTALQELVHGLQQLPTPDRDSARRFRFRLQQPGDLK